jgi:hypothetical protein
MSMQRLACAVFLALCGGMAEAREPQCALGADEVYAMAAPSVVQVQSISINPFWFRTG